MNIFFRGMYMCYHKRQKTTGRTRRRVMRPMWFALWTSGSRKQGALVGAYAYA